MTENTVTLNRTDETATALIRHERSTSKIRYAQYIAAHGVTLETVPDHVQALATLAGEIRKWEDGAARKAFCNKVRGGLKHHLSTPVKDETDETEQADVKYVTAQGLKDADREAFLVKCAAEYDAAHAV